MFQNLREFAFGFVGLDTFVGGLVTHQTFRTFDNLALGHQFFVDGDLGFKKSDLFLDLQTGSWGLWSVRFFYHSLTSSGRFDGFSVR
jgi:hypothetical protein